VVWDRSAGLGRIDSSSAGRVGDPRRLRAPFFTAGTPFRWDPLVGWHDAAIPAATRTGPAPVRLRVLTWNVLWDRYDGDRIDTARRRPLLLRALERADADVIALQEVEAGLLDILHRAGWVRSAGWTPRRSAGCRALPGRCWRRERCATPVICPGPTCSGTSSPNGPPGTGVDRSRRGRVRRRPTFRRPYGS
jgi:hypothetical protein